MSESKRRRVESTGSKEQVPAAHTGRVVRWLDKRGLGFTQRADNDGEGDARWSMDSKVAGDAILFGDKKTERFLAHFSVSSEQTDRITTAFPTLNCLRTMGPEDENNDKTPTTEEVWVNFCTEHKLPDEFKDAAAEHVVCDVDCPAHFTITHGTQVVERAVDSFFRWKNVTHILGDTVTWATLQRLDSEAEEGEDRLRAQRALRLLQGDIIHNVGENSEPHDLMLDVAFNSFCEKHPAWRDPSRSWVFFRDHARVKELSPEDRKKLKVTRIQHSGLCYMHAPAVLQHALVTLNSNGKHHEMLNVAKYIAKFFDARMIYEHVVEHEGGASDVFLENIMRLKQGDVVSRSFLAPAKMRNMLAVDLASDLKTYGVGLVAEFNVEPAFQGEQVSFKADALQEEMIGYHAMTLVGCREEGAEHLFLLQNWWRPRQFIEVSAGYLAAAEAKITFVKKEVKEIPKEFPTSDNVFSMETEDLGEQLVPEKLQ